MRIAKCFLWIAVLALLTVPASADIINVAPSDWNGSRAIGSGLSGIGNWASGVTLSWVITYDSGTDLYTYTYTFSHGTPATSHFILQVSDGKTADDFTTLTANSGFATYGSAPPNPGIPGSFYGVKFEPVAGTTTVITFTTDLSPIWGSFYAKGGTGSAAWNSGLTASQNRPAAGTTDFTNWVAAPDGFQVPEPATLVLLGTGLLGLGLVPSRFRR